MSSKSAKIHREGYYYIIKFLFFALLFNVSVIYFFKNNLIVSFILITISFIVFAILYNFFRIPKREHEHNENFIYSPADGKIVAIEKTTHEAFPNEEVNFISIFMSITDVHINFSPISGTIVEKKYFSGKHLVAYNPKSSEKNEQTYVIIKNNKKKILVRQVAGILARRIINNWEIGEKINQFEELGMIKLGSRVDIITPNKINIKVWLGQQVYAKETILAEIN